MSFDLLKETRSLILATEKEKYFTEVEKKMFSISISYNSLSELVTFKLNDTSYFETLLKFCKKNKLNIFIDDIEFILNDKFDFYNGYYELIYYNVDSMRDLLKINNFSKRKIYTLTKRNQLIKD